MKFDGITFTGQKGNFTVYPQLCKGCGLCIQKCPTNIIVWSKDKLGVYGTPLVETDDQDKCIACFKCEMACPDLAIRIDRIRNKPAVVK